MKAIIVAAGVGSRLGDLTKNLPKPLLDVNGKSILEHQIELFHKFGIKDVMMI
jgi:NDP-sugar pyrophosphorylase family protein